MDDCPHLADLRLQFDAKSGVGMVICKGCYSAIWSGRALLLGDATWDTDDIEKRMDAFLTGPRDTV